MGVMRCFRCHRRFISKILTLSAFITLGIYVFYNAFIVKFDLLNGNADLLKFRRKRFDYYQSTESKRSGPGEYGEPVYLEGEEKDVADSQFEQEAFYRLASDKIALDRAIPDVRDSECKDVVYPKKLPTSSVVIIFHNEAWSSLLRTVHSVINRSPPEYLHEVILLDDFSDRAHLGEKLKKYVQKTWSDGLVKMMRTTERSDIIRARLAGARAATGDVVVFLDSHCEVNTKWLEPLLARIMEDRTRIVCSEIDEIDAQTLKYSSTGSSSVGGFGWNLHFSWHPIPQEELKRRRSPIDPIRSPTMAGGLFATDRKFFFEIVEYGSGMDISGGENLELSFRVWMCGGSLEILPCSRVGHLFHNKCPYTFPGNKDINGTNSRRMAEVWMDDYKRLFYFHRKELLKEDTRDITESKKLKEKCKSFKWYLQNAYPDKFVPDENVYAYGMVRNPESNLCLDTLGKDEKYEFNISLYSCQYGASQAEVFSLTLKDEIRRDVGCLTSSGKPGATVPLAECRDKENQKWIHNKEMQLIIHRISNNCLDRAQESNSGSVRVNVCNDSPSQKWTFEHYLKV